jgi:hypothetical protein
MQRKRNTLQLFGNAPLNEVSPVEALCTRLNNTIFERSETRSRLGDHLLSTQESRSVGV